MMRTIRHSAWDLLVLEEDSNKPDRFTQVTYILITVSAIPRDMPDSYDEKLAGENLERNISH